MDFVLIRSVVLALAAAGAAVADEAAVGTGDAVAASGVVGADVWMSPRRGETFLRHDAVAPVVRRWLAAPDGRLEVHYPAGEGGELWGLELKAWLVALGVASDVIDLVDGYSQPDAVQLVYSPPGEDVSVPAGEAQSMEMSRSMQESP